MATALKVKITPKVLIEAIKGMKKKERDALVEDILALTFPRYLQSVKKARADHRAKRTKTHAGVFGG